MSGRVQLMSENNLQAVITMLGAAALAIVQSNAVAADDIGIENLNWRPVLAANTKQQNKKPPSRPRAAQPKQPDNKSQPQENKTTETEQPKPDPLAWEAEQIAEERKACSDILGAIDVIAIPEASFRKGGCGAPAPVRLVAVGKSPQVVLSPPAIMTCKLAAAVHRWTTQDLQKLAKKHLKDQVIRIEVMSDYACRNTYGRKNGKLSEHAKANALDIRGFNTESGKIVRLLASWGPTARDIAAEKARAEEARRARIEAEREAERLAEIQAAEQKNQSTGTKGKETTKDVVVEKTRDLLKVGTKLATAAKRALATGGARQAPMLPLSKRLTNQGRFLRDAHKAACRVFGTTLGPEANDAHRNHFHVDMRPRRRSNFCE